MVRGGNDYWYLVSSGVYEVRGGKLTVIADVGEEASEVDVESASASLKEAEAALEGESSFDEQFAAMKVRAEREKGRLEVHRRTESLH
jgi:F0F1-type ATP synthase epsilon subunit